MKAKQLLPASSEVDKAKWLRVHAIEIKHGVEELRWPHPLDDEVYLCVVSNSHFMVVVLVDDETMFNYLWGGVPHNPPFKTWYSAPAAAAAAVCTDPLNENLEV